jgi:uncharacterized protein GlcG (DUF336 family)
MKKSISLQAISLASADELIALALKACRDIGIEAAVAVTDSTGTVRAFKRTDGAPILTAEVATNKAWTASVYKFATHVWNDYLADPKVAPLAHVPRFMAVGGGYPIMEDGVQIGGIGISGGSYQQDQDVAVAALKEAGFDVPQ